MTTLSFFLPSSAPFLHSSMTFEESRFEIATTSQSVDYSSDTLILPCVSIGSIPQLAIDALLAPGNAHHLFGQESVLTSRLDHRYCVPFLGGVSPSASNQNNKEIIFEGPLQVYRFDQAKVTILQQRSPILKSRKYDFVDELMKWIQQKGFADVIILTSLDSGLRTDAQMNSPFWYVDAGIQASASQLQSRVHSILPIYERDSISSSASTLPRMPSGGLAKTYLEAAVKTLDKTPVQAIITFAAEGDNRHDALQMAALLSGLLGLPRLIAESFSQPSDWNLLFGPQSGSDGMFT